MKCHSPADTWSAHSTHNLDNPLYLDRFPPQYEESFSSLCEETRELVNQDMFYLICLFDLYADANRVDARFDENSLVVVARHCKRVQ
jgi:hypothetical protein